MSTDEKKGKACLKELFQEHPNLMFLVCSLALAILFWFITLLPEINRLISQFFKIDILYLVGSGSPIGPRKIRWFQIGAATFIGFNIALMGTLILKKGTGCRMMILVFILPLYPITISWLGMSRYDRFSKIRIENLPPIKYDSIFSKSHMLRARPKIT